MPIQYDLSKTLLDYPDPLPNNHRPLDDLDAVATTLVQRYLSPHAAASADVAGNLALPAPTNMFTATNSMTDAHEAIVRWRGDKGIIRLTPDDEGLAAYDGVATDVGLLNGFRIPVDELLKMDRKHTLVLSSPNGISGRIATLQELVRLTRHFRLVVIDERLGDFSLRRMNAMALEWENIVFVQRMPFRMPRQQVEFAWFLHPTDLRSELREHTEPLSPAALEDAKTFAGVPIHAAARHAARLKSQLYRELRKLSIVSVPYPSWSNSMLAMVERGDREEIVQQLADRGIAVYSPPHDNLQQHFRVTAISEEATFALKDALIEINRNIP